MLHFAPQNFYLQAEVKAQLSCSEIRYRIFKLILRAVSKIWIAFQLAEGIETYLKQNER